ncbi:MAG TPA: hypothetical protein VIK18_23680 [Pirellulales bacterium]
MQLRRNTINQARTVADIHQQQVLNNLAMFVYNPNSMPCFSYPTQGVNQVINTTNAGYTQGFAYAGMGPRAGTFLLNSLGFSLNGSHESSEAFTMVPINDPRKLELMRCAYQIAASSCGRGAPAATCPDCQARFGIFYTGDPHGNIRESTVGTVTKDCLGTECWFHVGCRKCVPHDCDCIYVGQYCGVYVWVLPQGRDELAKLTLAILDYAMRDPPVRLTKEVVYYIDEHGLPTTQHESVGKVTANIAINERNEGLLNLPPKEESALEQQLKSELAGVESQLERLGMNSKTPQVEDLMAQRKLLTSKLEYLKTQVNIQGLTHEFIPRDQTILGPSTPGPISADLLQRSQLLYQIQQ